MKESEQLVRLLEITNDLSVKLHQLQTIQALHLQCMTALNERLDRLKEQLNEHEKRFNSFN